MKRKSDVKYGSKVSGKPRNWISRGPFGNVTEGKSIASIGHSGFSLNGGTRNYGYVGKTYGFSTNSTPFKGIHAKGNGGRLGTYATPIPQSSVMSVITRGTQMQYIKPSVLSTRGMLSTKYRWIGRPYPNSTVQPMSANTALSLNTSQGLYIDNLSSRANINNDINQYNKYDVLNTGYPEILKSHLCSIFSVNKRSYSINVKNIRNAESSSENLHRKKQPCTNIEVYPNSVNGSALRYINFPKSKK